MNSLEKKLDLNQFPELKAVRERYEKLGGMLAAAQKDYDGAVRELGSATAAESAKGRRQLRAAALTSTGEGDVAVIDAVSATALREKIGKLHEEIATLHDAVQQQRQIVDRLQCEVSRSICEAIKPEYQAIVGNIATALVALGDAVDAEFAFRDQLREHGVQFTLPQVALHGMRISNRDMNDTSASRAMKEIIEAYPNSTKWRPSTK